MSLSIGRYRWVFLVLSHFCDTLGAGQAFRFIVQPRIIFSATKTSVSLLKGQSTWGNKLFWLRCFCSRDFVSLVHRRYGNVGFGPFLFYLSVYLLAFWNDCSSSCHSDLLACYGICRQYISFLIVFSSQLYFVAWQLYDYYM